MNFSRTSLDSIQFNFLLSFFLASSSSANRRHTNISHALPFGVRFAACTHIFTRVYNLFAWCEKRKIVGSKEGKKRQRSCETKRTIESIKDDRKGKKPRDSRNTHRHHHFCTQTKAKTAAEQHQRTEPSRCTVQIVQHTAIAQQQQQNQKHKAEYSKHRVEWVKAECVCASARGSLALNHNELLRLPQSNPFTLFSFTVRVCVSNV